jgi:CDP-diacylglycerol--glycerol-3-phosphate 3-phosphatidyltransferase
LPNIITLLRLPAIALIVWLSYRTDTRGLAMAAGLFTLCAVSDWLDGFLARRYGTGTPFGTLTDPLVDKLLILSIMFIFADLRMVPLWVVLLNMFRELLVTAVRHGASSRARVIGANWMGKVKFVLQVLLVELGFAYLLLGSARKSMPGGRALLFWAALAVTAVSFFFLLLFVLQHRRQFLADGPHQPSAPS